MSSVIFGNINQLLISFFKQSSFSQIAVLVDENTLEHCYPLVKNNLPIHIIIEIRSGELNKNLNTCELIWNQFTENQFDRKSLLVNLGGGVIGDMGGFCASTYKRGISFINIPTTLLSMVDASVGGKTGIDFDGFKNQIGIFSEPQEVFIDNCFLETLNKRQKISGAAEIIKHGLISNLELDTIFSKIQNLKFDMELIEDSVQFKKTITENDFKESGERKVLNFGHTVGHGIESYLLNKEPIFHGEAIMVGMICELFLSIKFLNLEVSIADSIIKKILSIYCLRKLSQEEISEIVHLVMQDKKNLNKEIKCVLLKDVGNPKYDITILSEDVSDSLKYYNSVV